MRKTIFAISFFLVLAPVSVIAQNSYTAETADKKYIFVMRRKGGDDYLVGDKYPHSGMYLNDGSTAPLWTVDWENAFICRMTENTSYVSADSIIRQRIVKRLLPLLPKVRS